MEEGFLIIYFLIAWHMGKIEAMGARKRPPMKCKYSGRGCEKHMEKRALSWSSPIDEFLRAGNIYTVKPRYNKPIGAGGLTLYPIIRYIQSLVKLPNEFTIYGVSFIKTCSYRSPRSYFSVGSTVGSRYVVVSEWREHERDQPFTVRVNCGLNGVRVSTFMFKQSGEFGWLTPRLGYNKLWFIISDLVQPGNDVRYVRNSL